MAKTIKILVSSISVPTSDIGSWTTRISKFIYDNPKAFDYILSPSSTLPNSIRCNKRAFITWKKPLREIQLKNWVALDFLKNIKRLSKVSNKLIIVVMDDPHLIEAISLIKSKLPTTVQLIYSFHGFELSLSQKCLLSIDRILWLSNLAIKKNKNKFKNLPESTFVGNAVDSNIFYPLRYKEFNSLREKLGFKRDDEIILWMANDRPKKGFRIFKEIAMELFAINSNFKFIVIGTKNTINHPNVTNIGRVPNNEIAKYLQIGNYYLFTTLYEEGFGLSLVEAYKCGNVVISSNLGAIPEVLQNLENSYLIDEPNNVNLWIEKLLMIRSQLDKDQNRMERKRANEIWNYKDWSMRFLIAIS